MTLKVQVSVSTSEELKLTFRLFPYSFICDLKIWYQFLRTFPFAKFCILRRVSSLCAFRPNLHHFSLCPVTLVVDMRGLGSLPSSWAHPRGGLWQEARGQGGRGVRALMDPVPPPSDPLSHSSLCSPEAVSICVLFPVSITKLSQIICWKWVIWFVLDPKRFNSKRHVGHKADIPVARDPRQHQQRGIVGQTPCSPDQRAALHSCRFWSHPSPTGGPSSETKSGQTKGLNPPEKCRRARPSGSRSVEGGRAHLPRLCDPGT